MNAEVSAIDRLRELGGELFLEGDRLTYRIPAGNVEARQLLEVLRRDRDAVAAMVRELQSLPPSLELVKASFPPGITLVSYQPKAAPFAVAPVSVVTNAGRFFHAYLRDLNWRLEHPDEYAAPPLPDILAKLAEGGLELALE